MHDIFEVEAPFPCHWWSSVALGKGGIEGAGWACALCVLFRLRLIGRGLVLEPRPCATETFLGNGLSELVGCLAGCQDRFQRRDVLGLFHLFLI